MTGYRHCSMEEMSEDIIRKGGDTHGNGRE